MKIALIFGGKSAEHEVSLQSAKNILAALDDRYDPVLIGISRTGKWYHLDKIPQNEVADSSEELSITPGAGSDFLMEQVDVVFPILHGPFGEDGTMQGLLKMVDIPFVGPSVLGSAVAMDKEMSKNLLKQAGIPVVDFMAFKGVVDLNAVEKKFDYPIFVKPANLGSSVGVSKVFERSELRKAVEEAFKYDKKILVEDAISGRELECSVLGNERPIASRAGEVKPKSFYSYSEKYSDESDTELIIPADLNDYIEKEIKEMAIRSFKALGCEGMARVDFFLTEDEILVNEINTIPGFTKISMYPKLWEVSGINYSSLITELIDLAIKRYERDKSLRSSL